MALETGDYIKDLDRTNPVNAVDPVGEGDDHLRLLKKCIQNSFGAFEGTAASPKSVTLTEDQINDAALKSATNTYTASNIFTVGPRLNNDVSLNGRNVADNASATLIKLGAADILTVGQDTVVAELALRSLSTQRWFVGGQSTVQGVTRANGSLRIADSGGTFGNVAAIHKENVFAPRQQFTLGTQVPNNVAYSGTETDGTRRLIGYIDGSDRVRLADPNLDVITEFNSQSFMRRGGIDVAVFAAASSGSVLVRDRIGNNKKAAFRNPTVRFASVANYPLSQDDEDTALIVTTSTMRATQLEATTQMALFNADQTLTIDGIVNGVTFTLFDASGTRPTGQTATVPGASVVGLYWRSATSVYIWGAGVSVA